MKKESGERAGGTLLDRGHPGYAPLMAGKRYLVTLGDTSKVDEA